jgi:hypothetical protein
MRGVIHAVQDAVESVPSCNDKLGISVSPQLLVLNVPRQSPDFVWKNPVEQVSHKPPDVGLVIHPAAHVHVLSDVQVPCKHPQPTVS